METSYELLNRAVQNKITILKEEAHLSMTEQAATVLVHYTKRILIIKLFISGKLMLSLYISKLNKEKL